MTMLENVNKFPHNYLNSVNHLGTLFHLPHYDPHLWLCVSLFIRCYLVACQIKCDLRRSLICVYSVYIADHQRTHILIIRPSGNL